jgi:NodT family efflux transporter outer membrane factor (OMF) lipoprotein
MEVRSMSMVCRSVIALALAAGLSGCKVGPDYRAPEIDAPGDAFAHTGGDGFAGPSRTVARAVNPEWWRLLNDPALDSLIERGVRGNLDVRLAEARVREARAARGIFAAEGLPTVDVGGSAERSRGTGNTRQGRLTGGEASNLFQVGFDAGWELDVFGGAARSVEAAERDIEAAEDDRRAALVTLVSEVARNYVELRGFQRRLEIARQNIATQRDVLGLTRSRFQAGLTSDLDVAQAESSVAAVEATVPLLDQGVQQSIHRLGVLLGARPETLLQELSGAAPIPEAPAEVPVGLPSELLLRRPDVRAAERRLAAETARIGVATADLYPRFSLTGSFGLAADKVPSVPDASSRFWSFGPAVRWPILDWGRIRSNIEVQGARAEGALIQFERAMLASFEDTENALSAFSREQARRASLAESVNANRRAFDLANQLYTAGLADFQRVLDSQRALFASEDALVDSQRAVATNLVALYKALGGGWDPFAPARAEPERFAPPPPSSHLAG